MTRYHSGISCLVIALCVHGAALQPFLHQQQQQGIISEIPPVPLITMDMIMSGRTPDCDDGKTNLTVDWNGSASEYRCFNEQWTTPTGKISTTTAAPVCGPRPTQALHVCMKDTISYTDNPPSSGNHRPSWPMYGEYTYVPPQRWLHSLEHGAVVFLYHPCADTVQTDKLRQLVTECLRRHIITPYNKLSKETPFALLTWGCKLLLPSADVSKAASFIQAHAKHGPEELDINGQYNEQLRQPAAIVTDLKDSILCPNWQPIQTDKSFFM